MVKSQSESPFHKLSFKMDISTRQINCSLNDQDIQSAAQLDAKFGMSPLHMLAVNAHAPADALGDTLLHANMDAVVSLEIKVKNTYKYNLTTNYGIME